ncbi:hypothetical protein GALMADRAFT_236388 [Galerina marginata CBS 339.88]|uniref:Uncharacterized protein n=1 Tax=Galerina marginata (strain CBS 339.88) TaxID=685588 RepID=A0A067TXY5_GALM3|nr:hypothetical protein GALMADRAFT_236388 [Galerina marginata CBS 339.88]
MITKVEKEKSDVQLAQILSRILLALRYAREKPDLEEVAKKRGIMVELMKKWIRAGQNYARLACAGSVYLLLMIAHVDGLHTTITRMSIDNMKNLLQILMHPNPDTDEGRYVVETVIPTISELRRKYPTTMASIFSDPGIPPVSCPDLPTSEAFFRSFLPDLAYLRPRNPIAWRECLSFVEHVPSRDRTLVLDTVTQEARKETDA